MHQEAGYSPEDLKYEHRMKILEVSAASNNAAWLELSRLYDEVKSAHTEKDRAYTAKKNNLIELTRNRQERNCLRPIRNELASIDIDSVTEEEYLKAQAELSSVNEQIRVLQSRIDYCYETHEAIKESLDKAKAEVEARHKILNKPKAKHKETDMRLKRAKLAARKASADRVKLEQKDQAMAIANIPSKHQADAKVMKNQDDQIHIYYGGSDRIKRQSHGHAVVEPSGIVSFHRKPGEARSDDHFLDDESRNKFKQSRN